MEQGGEVEGSKSETQEETVPPAELPYADGQPRSPIHVTSIVESSTGNGVEEEEIGDYTESVPETVVITKEEEDSAELTSLLTKPSQPSKAPAKKASFTLKLRDKKATN